MDLVGMGHGLETYPTLSRYCMGKNCDDCEGVALTGGYGRRIMPTDCDCECHKPEMWPTITGGVAGKALILTDGWADE